MKKHSKTLRTLTAAAIIVIITVGFVTNVGLGTMSAPGIGDLSILCPLGALGTMLASKMMVPRAVISLVAMVLLIVVFARAFCDWMCPVPLVQKLRGVFSKGKKPEEATAPDVAAPLTEAETAALASSCDKDGAGCASCSAKRGAALDARHFVLGGALVSTVAFGFPVFCLVCPIGLTFASIIALVQLFGIQTLSWGVVLFPLFLILEVTVLRKWCSRFCPLGALLSLLSLPNRLFRPKVDEGKCLRTKGVDCTVCADLCPEALDPHVDEGLHDCSKCRDCAENCPAGAISFPVRR